MYFIDPPYPIPYPLNSYTQSVTALHTVQILTPALTQYYVLCITQFSVLTSIEYVGVHYVKNLNGVLRRFPHKAKSK